MSEELLSCNVTFNNSASWLKFQTNEFYFKAQFCTYIFVANFVDVEETADAVAVQSRIRHCSETGWWIDTFPPVINKAVLFSHPEEGLSSVAQCWQTRTHAHTE
jgi:hypothetical protein